jgi:hypothetical protein
MTWSLRTESFRRALSLPELLPLSDSQPAPITADTATIDNVIIRAMQHLFQPDATAVSAGNL